MPDGFIAPPGIRDRAASGEAPAAWLCFQTAGVSVDAELGVLSADHEAGARNGILDYAVRRAAARGCAAEQHVRDSSVPLAPGEIEDCLVRHPAIKLACVVGKPDPEGRNWNCFDSVPIVNDDGVRATGGAAKSLIDFKVRTQPEGNTQSSKKRDRR